MVAPEGGVTQSDMFFDKMAIARLFYEEKTVYPKRHRSRHKP